MRNEKETIQPPVDPAGEPASEEKKPNAFGGYLTRHEFEKARRKSRRIRLGVYSAALVILLSVFAVLGLISLLRGNFSEQNEGTADGGVIRVPTKSDLSEEGRLLSEAIAETEKSVICVELISADQTAHYGSGFLISDNGYAVCSASLLDESGDAQEINVVTGEGLASTAQVEGIFRDLGVGLLKLHTEIGYPAVTAGRFSGIGRGQRLFVVGAQNRPVYAGTLLAGTVAMMGDTVSIDVGGVKRPVSVLFLDMKPNASLFGAPVMDEEGKVIGFCTDAVASPYEDLVAVVPIHMVYTIVNDRLDNS